MPVVRLLGPVDVVDDAGRVVAPRSPLRRCLLALLAVERGRFIEADRLLDMAWNAKPPSSGLGALRFHIHRLRSELDIEGLILTHGTSYQLQAAVDVAEIEAAVRSGRSADEIERLLGLWRGDAMADVALCPPLEHEQLRLEELRLALIEELFQARLARGEGPGLVGDLTRLCQDHPLREVLWACLITAHYVAGHQADALRSYDRLRTILAETLGVDPSPALQELERQVLRHDLEMAPILDRRLRARIGRAPDPRSSSPDVLPPRFDSFHGRTEELANLGRLLDKRRLVTVVGPGGLGKTRLIGECAAQRRSEFRGGVWFVDLSSVTRGEAVPHVVGSTLGIRGQRRQSIAQSIAGWIADSQSLMILDNCEQVRPSVRALVDELMSACPEIRFLASSREPLGHRAEQLFQLGPLDERTFAVDLFCDRAAQVNPAFDRADHDAAIERICAQVAGIPLAVELAAARTAVLTPTEISDRLAESTRLLADNREGRPSRHRTLSVVVESSIESLHAGPRHLLRRVSLFAGGFSLEACNEVCSWTPLDPLVLVDQLEELTIRCLITATPEPDGASRYRILEPIRQMLADELRGPEALEVAGRHAHWFAHKAQQLQRQLLSPAEASAAQEIGTELPNLRKAHDWAVDHAPHTAAELVTGLTQYMVSRLDLEIVDWFDRTLEVLDPDDPWFDRTMAAALAGWLLRGRYADVREAHDLVDWSVVSPFLRDNAQLMFISTEHKASTKLAMLEALAAQAIADDDQFIAVMALSRLGQNSHALDIATASGIPTAIAWAHYDAGRAAAHEQRDHEAIQHLTTAIETARLVGAELSLARALAQWAVVGQRLGLDRSKLLAAAEEGLAIAYRAGTAAFVLETLESAVAPLVDDQPTDASRALEK